MKKLIILCIAFVFFLFFVGCRRVAITPNRPDFSSSASDASSYFSLQTSEESASTDESSREQPREDSSSISEDTSSEDSSAAAGEDIIYKDFLVSGYDEPQVSHLLDRINEILRDSSSEYSIYYKNICDGSTIVYDGERIYSNASVIKAPYVRYILSIVEDMNKKIELQEYHIQSGAGYVGNQPIGTEFSIKDLIKYTITHSDNTAYKMLCEEFGMSGFYEFAKALGAETHITGKSRIGAMSVRDCGILFEDIYDYMVSTENGQLLEQYLTHTTYNGLIPAGIEDKTVAHKYGFNFGIFTVAHDAAIVFDEMPYILIIYSQYDPEVGQIDSDFISISEAIDEFHETVKEGLKE